MLNKSKKDEGTNDSKNNRLKIKYILCAVFGTLSIIGTGILSFMLYSQSMKASINNTESMLVESAVQASNLVNQGIESKINMVKGIVKSDDIINYNDNMDHTLLTLKANMEACGHMNIGIIDDKGMLYLQSGESLDAGSMNGVNEALSGQEYVSDPIYSKELNEDVIIYMVPVKDNNQVTGAIYYVREAAEISDMITTVKALETGTCFMFNEEGTMIAHENQALVEEDFNPIELAKTDKSYEKFSNVVKNMIKGEKGYGDYEFQEEHKMIAYAPVEGTSWSVGIGLPYEELKGQLKGFKAYALMLSLVVIFLIFAATLIIAEVSSRIINHLSDTIESLSNNDFDVNVSSRVLNFKSEFGDIGRNIDVLISSLGDMIKNIKGIGEIIDENSTTLSAFSEELSASSEDINSTIGQIAKGNTEQAAALKDMSSTVEKFKEKVDIVGTYIDVVHKNTMEIDEKAESSKDVAVKMDNSTKSFNEAFVEFNSEIKNLEKDMNTVENITNIINGISEQTNLLALNAAIEAARAGDAGKGFAVVAEEIRKLAEQSRNSSEEIFKIVNASAQNTKKIVSKTEEMNTDLKYQKENIDAVLEVLEHISLAVGDVIPELEKTYNEFEELNASSEEIRNSIESITEISEETSASSEEISASTMELNNSSRDLAQSAQELAHQSNTIIEELNKFKLKE